MNEVDDILGTSPQNDKYSIKQKPNNTKQNNYNSYKNNWKEEQNKARQEIYEIMNKRALDIIKNGDDFQKYLDVQSRFYKHSVGNECDVPRKAVNTLNDGSISSEYNKTENVLYVCRGMDRELLFSSLYREMASIEMKDIQDSELKSFRCYCISYMLCKRYGISVDNFKFSELPKEIVNKTEGKEIRQELEKIRNNYEKINSRIIDYFDISNKNKENEKKKSVQER